MNWTLAQNERRVLCARFARRLSRVFFFALKNRDAVNSLSSLGCSRTKHTSGQCKRILLDSIIPLVATEYDEYL